jgi:hypothetical protein
MPKGIGYGEGSIGAKAAKRLEKLQAPAKQKVSLLNAIMSPDAKQIKDRDAQQKALKREVGGRR